MIRKKYLDTKVISKFMNDIDFKSVIEEIKNRINIAEVIGKHTRLDKNNKAICPFHDDKNPSLSVNIKKQYFHCFGCGASGDVFKFLELITKKTFKEVLHDLADIAGVKISDTGGSYNRFSEERQIEEVLSKTASFYHKNLSGDAKDYLTKRGLNQEIIDKFEIGFGVLGLRDYLIKTCEFQLDLCLKAGVLKERAGNIIDTFYNRIIFSNIVGGRTVYLTGRSLDDIEPKYRNINKEITHLYNEDVLHNDEVFVVEGIIDCITLTLYGYPTVGIYGTNNFKPYSAEKFKNCNKVYIVMDGDEAGRNASIKISELLGNSSRIVMLPEGIDPNEFFLKYSKDDFEKLRTSSLDLIKYKINQIPVGIEKTELAEKIIPILEEISKNDSAKASAYLEYIKGHFKLKLSDINCYKKEIKKYAKEKEGSITLNKVIYTAQFEGLVDIVEDGGNSSFLIKKENELCVVSQFELDGNIFSPPPIEFIPFKLPRAEKVLNLFEFHKEMSQEDSDRTIYETLLYYHKGISELPQEEYYDLLVCWDFHTYLLEFFQYSPVICLFAVPERGKSRTGKGMIYVSYRGICIESLNEAHIIRLANDFGASLFFDVTDIIRKTELNKSEDIILSRYEKGVKVPRVLYPERGPFKDTVYFKTFGPTIIGTNEVASNILSTRAIIINMLGTNRRFDINVTEEYAQAYKECLVVFRARHMGSLLPEYQTIIPGRLGDITKPLIQIVRMVNPEREENLIKLIRKIESDRIIDNNNSLDGQILKVVTGLKEEIKRGILPVKTITDKFNDDKSDKFKKSYQKIGRRLDALGFEKSRTSNGGSAIIWDDKNIEKLCVSYGLELTSETSETSVIPLKFNDISDDTDVTDVL